MFILTKKFWDLLYPSKVHEVFYVDKVKVSVTIGESRRGGSYQEVENKDQWNCEYFIFFLI